MSPSGGSVRIGPISMFTLIAIICLSVLAVLTVTTANASYNMAQLQAKSVTEQYVAEAAAQDFLSEVDQRSKLLAGTGEQRVSLIATSLDSISEKVQDNANNKVTVTAETQGPHVNAKFACSNGRMLDIVVRIQADGSYEVVQWNMTATRNDAQSETLWSGM